MSPDHDQPDAAERELEQPTEAAGPAETQAADADSTVIDAGAQFAAAASGGPEPTPRLDEKDSAASSSEAKKPLAATFQHGAEPVETIVHVLRHGEVHNPNGILYGRLPG
ncbi:hypothetical protein ACWIG5_42625, partial [Streptomyces lydicus]